MRATVLESPDWVNVVALTPEEKVVVVRQHRFGTGQTTTEIPAGIVEPGETSQQAAIRELREETGYTSDEWTYLGFVEPNPAFLDNKCFHWVARNAVQTTPPALDEGENLQVYELSLDEIGQEIAAGRLRHALAYTALAHVFDLRKLLKS
jgi:8-oxo-dGTP pyrophosphatase MutT (NUDIX family)